MIPVYQDMTVAKDGTGNCYNACISSILEIPLREASDILPNTEGDWSRLWSIWLADKKLKRCHHLVSNPPEGYSIAIVSTDRVYPEDHYKHGKKIIHACVALDGAICHDPYPSGSTNIEILRYEEIKPMTDTEVLIHEKRKEYGVCLHGYFMNCETCEEPIRL